MRIALYVGSWPQNIGNAFFDLGLEAIARAAFPDAEITYSGGAVHWMFKRTKPFSIGPVTLPFTEDRSAHSFEIAEFAEVDAVLVPGMCISREFIESNGKTFKRLAERKIPVLFVGAGALTYTTDEAKRYKEFLDTFHAYAIITRDCDTTDILKEQGVQNIQTGIDCAFFLPNHYSPPKLSLPEYDVLNFDGATPPHDIDHQGRMVFRTHHDCWGPLSDVYTREPHTLVSDIPFDYLALYANTHATFSNRVHACIATLAYGNRARLFSNTPRASLFAEFGAQNIKSELVQLDMAIASRLKERQVAYVKSYLNELV